MERFGLSYSLVSLVPISFFIIFVYLYWYTIPILNSSSIHLFSILPYFLLILLFNLFLSFLIQSVLIPLITNSISLMEMFGHGIFLIPQNLPNLTFLLLKLHMSFLLVIYPLKPLTRSFLNSLSLMAQQLGQ